MGQIAGAKIIIQPNAVASTAITQLTGDVTAGPGPGSKAATLVATTNVQGLIEEYGDPYTNVKAPPYNATGNTIFNIAGNGHITSGLNAFTSATAAWTAADVGKVILIAGAGTAGAPLNTTIATFVSSTSITTTASAATTVTTAVFAYGTDDTAAFNSAISAVSSSGGNIWLPAGNYIFSSTLTIDPTKCSLIGPGSNDVTLIPTTAITGDAFRITEVTFVATIQSNRFGGFTVDGTFAGVGSCGWHYGDTIGGELNDLVVQNFKTTGAKGIWMDNRTNWTERTCWYRVWVNNNTIGVLFDVNGGTTSFGYHRILHLNVNANAAQVGVQFQAGAALYSGCCFISGNYGGASCTFINMTGSSTLGPSLFGIFGEMDTAGATGLAIAAGSGIAGGSGSINIATAGSTSTNSGYIQFGGWFNVLGIHTASEGVTAMGGISVVVGPNYPQDSGLVLVADGTDALMSANAGEVIFRPNGPGSVTGQMLIDTTGKINVSGPTAATATAGASGAIPASVAGYLDVVISGTTYKLPYYNV
jgi:hypothetical protein